MSDDVTESFRSSLDDLKMNSKPQISMLTMLAEDHEQYASDIVRVIEEQIKKVPVSRKLPIMYLIDSIIKNLSGTMYPQLFAQCIVPVFCGVFEEVDEKTRQAMYKLRQTWPDIIPNKQLYILDRKVQLIDPAWPITAKAPEHGVIHVNPKFLKPKEKEERSPQFSPVHSDSSIDDSIREELYVKEKELQKLRLELELAETKAKLEQQKKQLEQQALLKASKNIIDREPPPVIKLPPVGSSLGTAAQPVNRDPRLYRDPRLNRDPRLQRQQEREEQERLELEKEKVEAAAIVAPTTGVKVPPVESGSSVPSTTRMDWATLLNSFTNAATKVAAKQARKKHPSVETVTSKSSEILSRGKSPEIETAVYRSPETTGHRKSPETVSHRRSPETASGRRSPETDSRRRSPEAVSHRRSPEAVSHRRSPEAVSHRRSPEAVSHRSPEAVSHRSPEAVSHRSPEAVSHRSPEAVSHRISPEAVSHRSPEAVSQRLHEAVSQRSPEAVSQRKSPEITSQRKSSDVQLNDNEFVSDQNVLDNQAVMQLKPEPVLNVIAQIQKVHEPKHVSAKSKNKRYEDKETKRDKKWSPHGKDKEKQSSKDKDKRDSKDRKDFKDRDKRENKDRRDSKDSERSRDRRDSRERRSEVDTNRHGERRSYRHPAPEFKRGSYRDARENRSRGRHAPTPIHSTDRSDQYGRTLRSKSGSRSRDRSPVDRDERIARSPKEDRLRSERTSRDNSFGNEALHGESAEMDSLHLKDNGVYMVPASEVPIKVEFASEKEKIGDDESFNRTENDSHIKEVQNEIAFSQMEVEQDVKGHQVGDVENLTMQPKPEVSDSVMNSSEDVDMRIQQQTVTVKHHDAAEAGRPDKATDDSVNSGDSQPATVKRSYPDSNEVKPDIRPYKIPKLGAKKLEAKASDNQEDISKLFGEQDVDYRHPMPAAPVNRQSSVPSQNFLPSSGMNVKSPAQRRWSQFKESHPDDFAQDMERKRLRDAQMQSMVSEVQDVDLRPLTSSRQRALPLPAADVSVSIPKDLSVENQEQILQRAEQELKEGRISHGDHQEIVRQLGQVYDIQKKRHNFEDRPSRALDLRDPRLRGIRETKSPFAGDIDRRLPYPDDIEPQRKGTSRSHLPAQTSGDVIDQPSENSPRYREKRENYHAGYEMSPKEDFDARQHIHSRPRHEMEYERRRGIVDDFDGRSPKEMDSTQAHSVRDYDRAPLRYADYDGRRPRDVDRMSELSSHDIDARHPRRSEDDQRSDYRNENFRGSFDEYSRPHHMRGPPMRGDMLPREVREERLEDARSLRRNTPPSDAPFRGPPTEDEGHRPFGPSGPPVREPFISQGPRQGSVQDIRGPLPSFPGSVLRPAQNMPAPVGPRPLGPGPVHQGPGPVHQGPVPVHQGPGPVHQGPGPVHQGPGPVHQSPGPIHQGPGPVHQGPGPIHQSPGPIHQSPGPIHQGPGPIHQGPGPVHQGPGPIHQGPGPVHQGPGPVHQGGSISDPMDDPRWSAMRGLLDNEGTEEFVIDGKPFELRMGTSRKLRMYGKDMHVSVDLKERGIRIDGQLVYKLGEPIKEVPVIGKTVRLYYHGLPKPIWLDGQQHEMRVDAPPRNVMVDGVRRGFQIDGRDMMILVDRLEKGPYGGPPRKIRIAGVDHDIAFQAPPRRILIDNKSCELKLDSKIPYVIIDGKPHGIRFDGEPRTVFINDQPFTIPVDRAEKIRIGNRPTYIAFGGPAHEIIIDGKWFEVKFDNIPKDIHLGNRHFSIRIPGPLPRVKILDELPLDFDDSRLMSSNKAAVPQPRQHVPGFLESDMPGPMPFLQGHDCSQVPEQSNPGTDSMHQQEQPGSEGIHILASHVPDVINPVSQPGIDSIRPSITIASEGNLRPIGPLNSEALRFGQPVPQMIPQPSQPVITQPGLAPNLLQPTALRHGPNPMLGMSRPNVIGFQGMPQGRQNPRRLQQAQPVNLIAQGLLNQVASNMMSSTFQNIPDLAASLRALTQLNTGHPQPQPAIPPPIRHPQEDDHSAAMVTGMQGSSFIGQQKLPVIVPQKPSVPILPVPTIAPSFPLVTPMAAPLQASLHLQPTGSLGLVRPVMTTAASIIPGLSQPPPAADTTVPSSTPASIDINSLLNKLLQAGLIKDSTKSDTSTSETLPAPQPETVSSVVQEKPVVPRQKPSSIPDLTDFDSERMRQTHASVIEQLHEGVQCHTCGARFTMDDHEKYRAHLDWHFRQNKLEQEMVKVAKNRKWFYSIPDWIQYEELEDTMEKSRSEIFEQMRTGEQPITSAAHALSVRALEGKEVVKNPVASGVEGEDVCATCGDPFDQMWNEETEEWILKNTIKVDGKTYHPVCYEDAQETPTPVTVPTKNPLELQLQGLPTTVDNSSSTVPVEIKVEPMDIKTELMDIKTELMDMTVEPMDMTVEPMDMTVEPAVCSSQSVAVNLPVKDEVKPDPIVEHTSNLSSSRASTDTNSAITNAKSTDNEAACDTVAACTVPSSVTTSEVISCQGPTLLSTIATTVVREVIPVNLEDPMSPWEMDSNPTPELSRTPTPEPIQSFTPAQSVSSESLSSIAQGSDSLASEEPLPPALISAAAGVSKTLEASTVGRDASK